MLGLGAPEHQYIVHLADNAFESAEDLAHALLKMLGRTRDSER